MDTDLHQAAPSASEAATSAPKGGKAGTASTIIGSEAFVARVLRAMTLGARQAIAENAALEHRPANP